MSPHKDVPLFRAGWVFFCCSPGAVLASDGLNLATVGAANVWGAVGTVPIRFVSLGWALGPQARGRIPICVPKAATLGDSTPGCPNHPPQVTLGWLRCAVGPHGVAPTTGTPGRKYLALGCPTPLCPTPLCPILVCPIPFCPIPVCPIPSCPVFVRPIQVYPILVRPILGCPIPLCPILGCPIPSCPILVCPILKSHPSMSHPGVSHPRVSQPRWVSPPPCRPLSPPGVPARCRSGLWRTVGERPRPYCELGPC